MFNGTTFHSYIYAVQYKLDLSAQPQS